MRNPNIHMSKHKSAKILVCGVLPPPYFGHSMLYEMLMKSSLPSIFDVKFLNMHFWSYETNNQVTGSKLLKLLKYYSHFILLIASFRPTYILYNISFYKMPFLKDFLFCATGILLGRRVIIHDHGQYVQELYHSLPGWQKRMLRWMLKHAAGSIVMGESVRPVYQGLMDNSKIFVVPGVVEDTKNLDIKPDRTTENSLNILYFSHMSQSKGVFIAFDALALVLQTNRSVKVTFGGPMQSKEVASRLEQLQKEYPDRVRYLGYIEDVNKRTAIFRGADIFIFPTLRDVFGLVLLHAMAEGKAIVASREGTIPEIVMDGKTGFLCEKGKFEDFAKKILELLSDSNLRNEFSLAARKRFESVYCLEHYGKQMVEAFKYFSIIKK